MTLTFFIFKFCYHVYRVTILSVDTPQEEQEYMELVAAEKHQQEAAKSALAQNTSLSVVDEILEEIRKAADRLEEAIEEHVFDNNREVSQSQLNP